MLISIKRERQQPRSVIHVKNYLSGSPAKPDLLDTQVFDRLIMNPAPSRNPKHVAAHLANIYLKQGI
jgi:hypothetical protein